MIETSKAAGFYRPPTPVCISGGPGPPKMLDLAKRAAILWRRLQRKEGWIVRNWRTWAVLGLAVGFGVVYAVVDPPLNAQEMSAEQALAPKPALDTYELMELMVDPPYWALRDNLATPPERRQQLRAVYVGAYTMAEACNLMLIRTDLEYTQSKEWKELAIQNRDLAVKIGEAVKTRDYDTMKASYLAMIDACNKCHQTFDKDEPTEVKPWKTDQQAE